MKDTMMKDAVLITGASGLLGRELVRVFYTAGFCVFAQYRRTIPPDLKTLEDCVWLQADFSEISHLNDFLLENSLNFRRCKFLINNYGPITSKPIDSLTSDDILYDFYHNVITAYEITRFFLANTKVEQIVSLGYQGMEEERPYKKISSYAGAKTALKIMMQSLAAQWSGVGFHFFKPPTLMGADVRSPRGEEKSPVLAAEEIARLVLRAPESPRQRPEV